MPKEAYYFSHDANAQDDPKCMLLIDQMGMEGYGIFWALIERLRNETTYTLPLCICNALAKRWGTSREKIETVIKNYGLFMLENEHFFSNRLKESMNLKSEKARLSASYRWNNANASQSHSVGIANGVQKDANKRKKKKEKEKRGVNFSADGSKVFFDDNSSQDLGLGQQQRYKEGNYQPHYIIKGKIE
jgi:uncharacterized protein DUF4373